MTLLPLKPARFGSHMVGFLIIALSVVATSAKGWAGENTLLTFTGPNGIGPVASLALDSAGNLYGTTSAGGPNGNGTVFKLTLNSKGVWTQSLLYSFDTTNHPKGPWGPFAPVVLDSSGNIYGTSYYGGSSTGSTKCGSTGCGTVFRLSPTRAGSWKETKLYSFKGGKDGSNPNGGVVLDTQGNLYGTTIFGGGSNNGTVFKLTPTTTGPWKETILHAFTGGSVGGDGAWPNAGPTFDHLGNLFGTTLDGGQSLQNGTVFELSPTAAGGWNYSVIHSFSPTGMNGQDGASPVGGVIADAGGNLYVATAGGGALSQGAVVQLTPGSNGWAASLLYSFQGLADGADPNAAVTLDSAGNLYGTVTESASFGQGGVFKLSPSGGGTWTESVLFSFEGTDGATPWASVTLDGQGNIYGTTEFGGSSSDGVVFEITP
jgi:uncharacterized repeat protein (TIGR03803 family)